MDRILPSFRAGVQIIVSLEKSNEVIRYTYTGEVPKELMDEYEKLVGNGLSQVGVSADMGTKEFGNGVNANVYVRVTCNQDQATMLRAVELAGSMARWAVREQHAKGDAEFQQMVAQKKAQAGAQLNFNPPR